MLPLWILNYTNKAMFDQNWCEEVRKCRGLIIHREIDEPWSESRIIARPVPKFFNLQETPETCEKNLPPCIPEVSEKMDGQLGLLWRWEDPSTGLKHAGIATRGSFESEGAVFATQKLQKLIKYGAIDEFPQGWTPHFEIIAKHLRIVVDYPYEGIVLLLMVDNKTGEEAPRSVVEDVCHRIAAYSQDGRPWIRLVESHDLDFPDCLFRGAMPSADGSEKNREGFVLTYYRPYDSPLKVKVKFEEYRRLHRLLTGVTPQQLWFALSNPLFQWTEGELPAHFRQWSQAWRDKLYGQFQSKLFEVFICMASELFLNAQTIGRRAMIEALQHLAGDPAVRSSVMSIYDGKGFQAHRTLWESIRPAGRQSETFHFEGKGE